MTSFKVGQKVVFLRDTGGGIVKEVISNHQIIIEDEDGFDLTCSASDLALVQGSDYGLEEVEIPKETSEEIEAEVEHVVRKGVLTGKRKPVEMWELDLHIESLTSSHRDWSNAQILSRQLSEFRRFVKQARAKRIRKLVIIHGVGEGVLKEEVRSELSKIEGVEYFDADFREYGKGATAVELTYRS